MRIGIEAQRLFRPHKHGMDRVALELIRNLQVMDTVNEYFIFVKPDHDRGVLSTTENFKIVEVPGGPYPIWEQFQLPRMVKKYHCDILHCTSNTAPLKPQARLVTTLHDIIYKEKNMFQQLFSSASWYQKLGNIYRSLIVNTVVKRSHRLITVSNFEKENIKNTFQLNDQLVTTVHNGVNEHFHPHISAKRKKEVKLHYQLPDAFMLHIGNTDPRKNTKRVLEAYYEYKTHHAGTCKLVIAGLREETLRTLLQETGLLGVLDHDILLTGYVADTDFPVLFSLAQVFLFPSLREGFGIPILEAMACGVPVITSSTSSMPEVAGDSAYLVNPYQTEDIAKAMVTLCSDIDYRNSLITKGLQQCQSFSWSRAAESVLAVYEELNTQPKTPTL